MMEFENKNGVELT